MSSNILKISSEERTPLVDALLKKLEQSDRAIEELLRQNQLYREEIALLREEIARLKGGNKRPKIRPNRKSRDKRKGPPRDDRRPGSDKVSKKESLVIHETVVVTPPGVPEGSILKRRREFDVQDLIVNAHNTRYLLEEWIGPDDTIYSAKLPEGIAQGHFGNGLCAFILSQHHQCQVTQGLLHDQLSEFGIDISTGQLNNILTENKEIFHQEKNEILAAGLSVSKYIQTDDTGARHDGHNGYCTHIGNEFFAWFQSSSSKSRINFLSILSAVYGGGHQLTDDAIIYMKQEGLPKKSLEILSSSIKKSFATEAEWKAWLEDSGIKKARHIRIASEAALLAGALASGLNREMIILSDDAGQFNVPMLKHALCWVHEERHLNALLMPGNNVDKAEALEKALDDFWSLYRKLQDYKRTAYPKLAEEISQTFDELFQRKTCYELLNLALKRIHAKKTELLLVLSEPALPLHNNGSESDIREFVKRRKVSGGTRSTSGQQCRDTFASLKKTCRKLGTSFYSYLLDRLGRSTTIEPLGDLIKKAAANHMALIGIISPEGQQATAA